MTVGWPARWTGQLSPELRFVAGCCAGPQTAPPTESLDWPLILRLTERHRVAGLVHRALRDLPPGIVPEVAARTITRRAAHLARRNLAQLAEVVRLDRAFAAAGIRVAVLKGATLALLLHGDPTLRHAKDIDLLVPLDSAAGAAALLEAQGYRRVVPAPTVGPDRMARWQQRAKNMSYRHPDSGLEIELHWRLFDHPWMIGRTPPPDAWVTVPVSSALALHTLAPDDLLTYLLGHGALHGWFRLKWLADLATLLHGHSPDEIEAVLCHAEAQGLGRAAGQGLILSALFWPIALPERLSRAAQAPTPVARLVGAALACLTDLEEPTRRPFGPTRINLLHYRLGTGWRNRWVILRGQIDSAEDWAALPLPRRLDWLYLVLRGPLWLARLLRRRDARSARSG